MLQNLASNGWIQNIMYIISAKSVVMPEEPHAVLFRVINLVIFDAVEIAIDFDSIIGGLVCDGKSAYNVVVAGDVNLLDDNLAISL